jgi:hypothetical protein
LQALNINLATEDLDSLMVANDTDGCGHLDWVEAARAIDDLLQDYEDDSEVAKDKTVVVGGLLMITAVMLVSASVDAWLLRPGLQEYGWSFIESLYFQAITATTIGLGDYAPAIPVYLITLIRLTLGFNMPVLS